MASATAAGAATAAGTAAAGAAANTAAAAGSVASAAGAARTATTPSTATATAGASATSPALRTTDETAATPGTGPSASVPGLALATLAASTTPTTATPATANATATQTQSLPQQLARPIFTLASAGRGDHVMTVHVTPDALGPVTVRAHVGAEGVRVELFAPTDGGRDALRAILPDLRRDLNGAGLSGSLDLSSQNQPQPDGQRGDPSSRQGSAPTASRAGLGADQSDSGRPDAGDRRSPRYGGGHTIDLVV